MPIHPPQNLYQATPNYYYNAVSFNPYIPPPPLPQTAQQLQLHLNSQQTSFTQPSMFSPKQQQNLQPTMSQSMSSDMNTKVSAFSTVKSQSISQDLHNQEVTNVDNFSSASSTSSTTTANNETANYSSKTSQSATVNTEDISKKSKTKSKSSSSSTVTSSSNNIDNNNLSNSSQQPLTMNANSQQQSSRPSSNKSAAAAMTQMPPPPPPPPLNASAAHHQQQITPSANMYYQSYGFIDPMSGQFIQTQPPIPHVHQNMLTQGKLY